MNQIYAEVLSYLRIVWRNRWVVLLTAWIGSVLGWAVVATVPDRYESSARVYIDTDSMLQPLMQGIAVQMDVFQRVDIVKRTLFSRPNLEKVMLMTDLDLEVETPEDKERVLKTLGERVKLRQEGLNLFGVAYQDPDPELARKVVQSVLSIFVETNLGATRTDMDETQVFLASQVDDYSRQLAEAEQRLADFKLENMGLLPGDGDYYSNVEGARSRLRATREALAEAETVRNLLQTQLAAIPEFHEVPAATSYGGGGFGPSAGFGPPSNIDVRILGLESEIDQLLLRYTEEHPDVVSARRLLESLRAQKAAEDEALAAMLAEQAAALTEGPTTEFNAIPNPVYQQLQVQLVNQESLIATLKRRAVAEEEAVAAWQERANTVPRIEAQLKDLTRDYDLIRGKYAELRERQEAARLAEELETKTNKVQFRIVDPPQVPITPIGPNRPLMLGGVFGGALGAGVGLAVLLGMLKGSFADTTRLRAAFPMPILGSVSAVLSVADRRRHAFALAVYGVVAIGLFSTFGGLLLLETLGGALAEHSMRIAEKLHVTFVFDLLKAVVQRLNLS